QRLARTTEMGQRPPLARGVCPLPALGAGILAALRRLRLPHHVAQRRLLVFPTRRLYGARRQHRPHSRRQVSSAAAGARERRWRARLFSMVRNFAVGVRAYRLSLGLPREPQTMAHRRPADFAGRDAALIGELLRESGAKSRSN